MAYAADISRTDPTVLLILLDQSTSMSEAFGGGNGTKAVEAARVVNRVLTNLTIKCAKADEIRNYFEVGVIGYGRSVGNAFGGSLGANLLQPISAIGENPLRLDKLNRKVSDGAGGLVEEQADFPVWIDPVANGATPMCQALTTAQDLLTGWVATHPDSFPPTVMNITDGEANDGDPVSFAQQLASIATKDGDVLTFNCHVSKSNAATVKYPATDSGLPDHFAQQLFAMSSKLPSKHLELAQSENLHVSPGSRGFVFNAGLEDLITFIEIGTRIKALSAELR